ncbi:MAG: restriction endonuclease subunit S [Deltaproteobacteria bacterium]|nr:restriction endonuclease subunit S [Deltaproteobacteria bacterium]
MAKQTDSKVPEVRFKGFEGEWKKKPIGEVLSEKKRSIVLDDNQRYELVTVKRRNGGVVSRGHLSGREILVKTYFQLETGDFLVSKRQVVHGATGNVPAALNKAIVSNEYLVAIGNSEISTDFLTIISSLPDMNRKFFLSSYGVDIEKLVFDVEDWKKRTVTIPKPTEQSQISFYFKEQDRLIRLHRRKHDKLVTLKQAMLQKMFPQDGATTPEIRFKGFDAVWRKDKLGRISESYSGGTPSVGNRSYYGGDIPFIRSGEINQNSTELTITELGLQKSAAKMVSKGDILYALYGATSGEVGISQINGAINQAILAIQPHSAHSSQFIAMWLRNRKSKILGTYLQGGQGNLSGNIVNAIEINLPSMAEQQKIGTYFCALDELISKHAIQLKKLKNFKSACLQKMFV